MTLATRRTSTSRRLLKLAAASRPRQPPKRRRRLCLLATSVSASRIFVLCRALYQSACAHRTRVNARNCNTRTPHTQARTRTRTPKHVHACTHTRMHAHHIATYTHTRTHARTHAHAHTCTHMHTLIFLTPHLHGKTDGACASFESECLITRAQPVQRTCQFCPRVQVSPQKPAAKESRRCNTKPLAPGRQRTRFFRISVSCKIHWLNLRANLCLHSCLCMFVWCSACQTHSTRRLQAILAHSDIEDPRQYRRVRRARGLAIWRRRTSSSALLRACLNVSNAAAMRMRLHRISTTLPARCRRRRSSTNTRHLWQLRADICCAQRSTSRTEA